MASGLNHHRNAPPSLTQHIVGEITLTSTPTEMKVGADILPGRTTLFIINDSSNLVFIADNNTFTPGVTKTIIAFSGEVITVDLDPNPPGGVPERFYAALEEGTNTIRVVEAK